MINDDSTPGPVTGLQRYACSCHAARAERPRRSFLRFLLRALGLRAAR